MEKIIESARFAKRKARRASAAWFLANVAVVVLLFLLKEGLLAALGGWGFATLAIAAAIAAAVGIALATAVDNFALAAEEESSGRDAAAKRLWMFKITVLMLVVFGSMLVTAVVADWFMPEAPSLPGGRDLQERMWESLCFLAMAWYEMAAVWALMALRPRWLDGGRTAD